MTSTAPSTTGRLGRRPRHLLWIVPLLVIALIVVAVGVVGKTRDRADNLAGSAEIEASSTRFGMSADAINDGVRGGVGSEWASAGGAAGSSVSLAWSSERSLGRIVIVPSADASLRPAEGYLSFDDGSSLLVQFPADGDIDLAFTPRDTAAVKLSVVDAGDAAGFGLAEVRAFGPTGDEQTDSVSGATREADGSGFTWPNARELSSVQLFGDPAGAGSIDEGRLVFSDGSEISVGEVLDDPLLPTTVAFMPRLATSVRLVIDEVSPAGSDVGLGGMTVAAIGSTLQRAEETPTVEKAGFPSGCPDTTADTAERVITVLCPVATSEIEGATTIRLAAPGMERVEAQAWPTTDSRDSAPMTVTTSGDRGLATVEFDAEQLRHGPVTIRLHGYETADRSLPPSEQAATYLQLYNTGGWAAPEATAVDTAGAMTLAWAEEFSTGVSISEDGAGATYSAGKPTYKGMDEFGDAIFVDPALGLGTVATVDDDILRIGLGPRPTDVDDPNGWGREHIGGMLSSARPGGSGFSAQYGYFEARMMVPTGEGTWPAFWMLSNDNLIGPRTQIAEIDTVELYGHAPLDACHSTHEYTDGVDDKNIQCGQRFDSTEQAMQWHVYGAKVTPTEIVYYIDGVEVASAPQIAAGEQPLFFMVNLALGGGWPIDLAGVGDSAAMYVDYIRVYT